VNLKLGSFEQTLFKEINDIKSSIQENNKRMDLLDFKLSDSFKNMAVDIKSVNKNTETLKSEIDSLLGFKELSMTNFKEFSEEFVKLY
jgi:uncharacterized protein YeeX (DUF496 family)